MIFGISPAPSVRQSAVHRVLQGITMCHAMQADVLTTVVRTVAHEGSYRRFHTTLKVWTRGQPREVLFVRGFYQVPRLET